MSPLALCRVGGATARLTGQKLLPTSAFAKEQNLLTELDQRPVLFFAIQLYSCYSMVR